MEKYAPDVGEQGRDDHANKSKNTGHPWHIILRGKIPNSNGPLQDFQRKRLQSSTL